MVKYSLSSTFPAVEFVALSWARGKFRFTRGIGEFNGWILHLQPAIEGP
jgi:hypothetical protein